MFVTLVIYWAFILKKLRPFLVEMAVLTRRDGKTVVEELTAAEVCSERLYNTHNQVFCLVDAILGQFIEFQVEKLIKEHEEKEKEAETK